MFGSHFMGDRLCLVPISCLLSCPSASACCYFCLAIFLLMVHSPNFFLSRNSSVFFIKTVCYVRDHLLCMDTVCYVRDHLLCMDTVCYVRDHLLCMDTVCYVRDHLLCMDLFRR